ncbi:murein biosynthesis integral membrane protein MurJ [Actinoalloteichus sp. GBA129-24]|uniref:murein biosynthesis integral membrane protein MurJ n=1 Tax=Actinoalloteichus sp. GBA129-24 TaxID=1612551 RepID=UPI001E4AF0A2|nr:murein biosynthesis integral membrane protein MurJ [Actinoalloteichus sp. GBA129-24]
MNQDDEETTRFDGPLYPPGGPRRRGRPGPPPEHSSRPDLRATPPEPFRSQRRPPPVPPSQPRLRPDHASEPALRPEHQGRPAPGPAQPTSASAHHAPGSQPNIRRDLPPGTHARQDPATTHDLGQAGGLDQERTRQAASDAARRAAAGAARAAAPGGPRGARGADLDRTRAIPVVDPVDPVDPEQTTQMSPVAVVADREAGEAVTDVTATDEPQKKAGKSLLKASGTMAIATLISRITGFLWKAMLAWVVGLGLINDSFTVANNLPTIITELLLGGVLTSIVVPVLVRAQKEDSDGGLAYTQRLVTLATVILGVGTLLSVIAAPLLTAVYVSGGETQANRALVTAFAYLLLPQILFYGLSALLMAILQSKQVFGPPAWAPVVNNVVIIGTILVYWMLPGDIVVNPVRMTDAHLLVLGIGVTLGVVAQAAILIPALRRSGFRPAWRWGWDSRLSEFGGLAAWVIGYALVGMLGVIALTRVATAYEGSLAIYQNAWLLLQLPYGVIGFSIMTAVLPRMSRAAADEDYDRLKADLSLGARLCTLILLPMSVLMTVFGTQIGISLFSLGEGAGGAGRLGQALVVSAFGLLPYAITMLQLRVFYAMKDSRTPTLILAIMTAIKVPLLYLCPVLLDDEQVVLGITFVNSFTFVIGWVIGEIWLRSRIGKLGNRALWITLGKAAMASIWGGGAALLAAQGVGALMPQADGAGTAWVQLIAGSVLCLIVTVGFMLLLKVRELDPLMTRVRRMAGR